MVQDVNVFFTMDRLSLCSLVRMFVKQDIKPTVAGSFFTLSIRDRAIRSSFDDIQKTLDRPGASGIWSQLGL